MNEGEMCGMGEGIDKKQKLFSVEKVNMKQLFIT